MKKENIVKMVLIFFLLFSFISVQSVWSQNTEYQGRPIQLGTSGGNINDVSRLYCCTGTLGALVQDDNGVQYILSNNHVLARTNKGRVGEDIIQPGLADQMCVQDTNDAVADLSRFKSISFKRVLNEVDAAIAQVRDGMVNTSGSIIGIGQVSSLTVSPSIGMRVKKSGRTTGLTNGAVLATNVTIAVAYNKTCGIGSQIAYFKDQIRIGSSGFSAGGDSGSLIVDDCSGYPSAVGLLFAGSSTDTFANPIANVLSSLGNILQSTLTMVGTATSCTTSATSITGSPSMTAQPQLPPHANQRAVEAANRIKERHEEAILELEGVVGIGIGVSETLPEEVVIEIYVKKSAQEMKHVIPEILEDVPVKIVETGEIVAF